MIPRSSNPRRKNYLPKSSVGVRKVNPKRRKAEFARCYHSKERVEFVKSLGCIYCASISPLFGRVSRIFPIHNAHTENGGRGRKADYTTIIPLCTSHHRRYDEHLPPFDKANQSIRDAMKNAAAEVQRRWLEFSGESA